MDKILHVASTFKSHENDDGSVMIRGMASTNHSDRAGDVISADAWTKGGLENFKNNPVILFNHDYDKPIGRATGVKVTENGLELEAKISKSAPAAVCELVKDGVLGAFSVGFKVKDADYLKETDGLMIKDAELFEVSVVSVPCNQAATFSLAKSFDSQAEYEEFKKTFTNRVDLPGQSLTKDDSKESNLVSDAPKHVEQSTNKETKMSEDNTPAIDLEAFAKKVADETAAKIAMKQAEQKAADEAEQKAAADAAAEKAAQDEQVKSTIRTGIETGAEKLQADMEADFAKASVDQIAEVTAKYEADLKEKAEELEAMRNSKRDFSGRQKGDLSAFGKEFLSAHILGKVTRKGWDTAYGQDLLEKAGVQINNNAATLDQTVTNQFYEEMKMDLKVASLFRELPVNSGATIIPLADDTNMASFSAAGLSASANQLENRTQVDANEYDLREVTALAKRLISGTFIANDTDEQVVVTILPMITSALARAHARAIENTLTVGTTAVKGILGAGTDGTSGYAKDSATVADLNNNGSVNLTAANLMSARGEMGKYGVNPSDVAYVVSIEEYYNLVNDPEFSDVSEVGSDLAAKLVGVVGSVYGSPVIATDAFSRAANSTAGFAVNVNNYVMPRLRGVNIETDYDVTNQRTAVIASQSLGFTELYAGDGASHEPSVRIEYTA